jgi:shikimate dehydrogenase
VVLGAGGAARAVVHALLEAGVAELRLANRTRSRAETLAQSFAGVRVFDWGDARVLEDAALLANSTSLGMSGQPPLEIALDRLPPAALVTDLVYSPLETALLSSARARGNATVDGLGMLLHQARPGFAAWFGREPEVDEALRRAVLADS